MKSFISTILSILLLLSSTGITYAQHYCGEYMMVEKITIGHENLSCGMVVENSSCADEKDENHNCCDNEYTSVNIDDNFSKASFDLVLNNAFFVAFTSVFIVQLDNIDEVETIYKDYNPPPLIKDILVLHETFLI